MISLSTFGISSEIGNITSHGIKTGHGVLNVADASCSVATFDANWMAAPLYRSSPVNFGFMLLSPSYNQVDSVPVNLFSTIFS